MPVWTINAKEDLKTQLAYIAQDNIDAAKDSAIKIKVSCAGLDEFPSIGRSGSVKNTRELVVQGTPYVCVYRNVGCRVQILRLLHTKMMWPE